MTGHFWQSQFFLQSWWSWYPYHKVTATASSEISVPVVLRSPVPSAFSEIYKIHRLFKDVQYSRMVGGKIFPWILKVHTMPHYCCFCQFFLIAGLFAYNFLLVVQTFYKPILHRFGSKLHKIWDHHRFIAYDFQLVHNTFGAPFMYHMIWKRFDILRWKICE